MNQFAYQQSLYMRRTDSHMQWKSLALLSLLLAVCTTRTAEAFTSLSTPFIRPSTLHTRPLATSQPASKTALNVWWFGGSQEETISGDGDSCELVAVRIERTSPNSRRIFGEIVAPVPLEQVWRILTDYDRLAVHVPNLVESRITRRGPTGVPGDGSYQCRLFQKGAQKIIGFEFGASVTMDMKEVVPGPKERLIYFKCTDSFFFSEFDGEWRAQEQTNAMGQLETVLSYVVDVRPKGPVPVQALEWRIREDVPTNLRAVKRAATAAMTVPAMSTRPLMNGASVSMAQSSVPVAQVRETAVMPVREEAVPVASPPVQLAPVMSASRPVASSVKFSSAPTLRRPVSRRAQALELARKGATKGLSKLTQSMRANVHWDPEETMAVYLKD
jgi:Polyketide cyclase / dehydrase and lipid transport